MRNTMMKSWQISRLTVVNINFQFINDISVLCEDILE